MLIAEQNAKGASSARSWSRWWSIRPRTGRSSPRRPRELISKQGLGRVRLLDQRLAQVVLPVFKELDNILFYPVQYEGEESERNVFYTGAAPNQQRFRRSIT